MMATGHAALEPFDSPSALQSCLERVAAGDVPDVVLAGLPLDQRATMTALFATARLARTLRPQPTAAFRERLGAVLRDIEVDAPDESPFQAPVARPPRRRAILRLAALATAAVLALGVFATGAGASPRGLLDGLREAVARAFVVAEHWVAPRPLSPSASVAIRPVPTSSAHTGYVAPEPAFVDQADGAPRPPERRMVQDRPARPKAPMAQPLPVATATSAGPSVPSTPEPSPTAARAAEELAYRPPTPMPAPPTPTAGVVVSPVEVTAVARGPAPIIAPAPPAVIGGAGIAGKVTFSDETAFPGVLVTAYPLDRSGTSIWHLGVSIRTDLDGRYLIPGLWPGRYKVAAGERGPWATRRWYLDTRIEHEAMPVVVEPSRITGDIDVRTRAWPFGDVLIVDPNATRGWLRLLRWY